MENLTYNSSVDVLIEYNSIPPEGWSFEIHNSKSIIQFSLEIEHREWGIKGIFPSVPNQIIKINLPLLKDGEDSANEYTIEIHLQDLKIEDTPRSGLSSVIAPKELEIKLEDFKVMDTYSFSAQGVGVVRF